MDSKPHPYPGKFIVFEGIDGSGKTTLIQNLSNKLTLDRIRHKGTYEPGGYISELKELVVILGRKDDWNRQTILNLFLADRYLHIQKVIIPALEEGLTVLCDRYEFSTIVYQGIDIDSYVGDYGEGRLFRDSLRPDMTIILDCDPADASERLTKKYGVGHCDEGIDLSLMRNRYIDLVGSVDVNIEMLDSSFYSEKGLFDKCYGLVQEVINGKDKR